MKRILCLLLAIMMIVLFIGCSEIEKYNTETQQVIPEEINYPVTAEDITFDKAPQKVISLSPATTYIMCEFGFEEFLVGISEYCEKTSELENVAVVGSPANPDIDGIIALAPEVVFTQSPISLTDMTKLDTNGIKVIHTQSPKGLNELVDYYAMISLIFMGNGYYNDATKEKFKDFDEAFGKAQSKEMSFSFIYILTDDMGVATGDTLSGDILSIFGENIADEYENMTMETEKILEANPDIIFIANEVDTQILPEEIKSLEAFQNNVVKIDNNYFEQPTTDIAQLIDNLTTQLGTKRKITDKVDEHDVEERE